MIAYFNVSHNGRQLQRFEKIFLQNPMPHQQGDGQDGVEQGGLPLDETFVMQSKRQRTKAHHQHQSDFLHGGQFALHQIHRDRLHHSGRHQYACGGVNVTEFVGDKKQQDGKQIQ